MDLSFEEKRLKKLVAARECTEVQEVADCVHRDRQGHIVTWIDLTGIGPTVDPAPPVCDDWLVACS